MGRHDEAATELRTARKGERDRQRLYLIELFLGREEQTLGRRNEARRHFENAAALYPNAQSPRLSLSLLARQAGDRKNALLLLQQVNMPSAASDPFWLYHEHHADDADALMEQMRTIGERKQ
jgi:tetratricopeptide (TPR) repeat protein